MAGAFIRGSIRLATFFSNGEKTRQLFALNVQHSMIEILQGNCLDRLKDLEDQSVNTCITSPPYWGLRDYGEGEQLGLEDTPEEYVENLVNVFREVKRVLRDDGTVWLNLGDSYVSGKSRYSMREHRILGGGKNENKLGILQKGAKKDLYGHPFYKDKDLAGIPWRVAFALQEADGWYLRQDIIWHKPVPMPESVKDRCTKAHEYIFLLSKNAKYYYDNEAIKTPVKNDWGTRDRTNGKYHNEGSGLAPHSGLEKSYETANKRSVWTVATKPYSGAHFATYPPDLIKPCVLAGGPEGGTILDPFAGSGTTGMVAKQHNRNAVLIELNTDYIKILKQRINPPQTDFFFDERLAEK